MAWLDREVCASVNSDLHSADLEVAGRAQVVDGGGWYHRGQGQSRSLGKGPRTWDEVVRW